MMDTSFASVCIFCEEARRYSSIPSFSMGMSKLLIIRCKGAMSGSFQVKIKRYHDILSGHLSGNYAKFDPYIHGSVYDRVYGKKRLIRVY